MKTIIIDRKLTIIKADKKRLIITIPDKAKALSVPLKMMQTLVLATPITLSTCLFTRLTKAGVVIVIINPRDTSASTFTHGLLHNAADTRIRQYQIISQQDASLLLAKSIVKAKLESQIWTLLKVQKNRPDKRYALIKAEQQIREALLSVVNQSSKESLRGIEGAASRAYFKAFQSVFACSLHFLNRNRRPPLDPVNVTLSLTYTLLHGEVTRALIMQGFDPYLGIYHQPKFGRESLACDLIESYRPWLDYWVWRLFAEQQLTTSHFVIDHGATKPCLMVKAGRKIFYQQYQRYLPHWRKHIKKSAAEWKLIALQDQ